MNDESIVKREILSNRAAAEALQAIAGAHNYPGGSSLLNAEAESIIHVDDAELDPTAKKIGGNLAAKDRFEIEGNYPISFEHTSDDKEDDLSLTNDVAIDEESDFVRAASPLENR